MDQWTEVAVVPAGFTGLGDAPPTLFNDGWYAKQDNKTYKWMGDARQDAARAMNAALAAHGYSAADQPLYRAFQAQAGLTADGYPGPATMAALQTALGTLGVPMANVPIYPWSASGGYDGINAPTQAQWLSASGGNLPVIVVPGTVPATTTTSTTSSTTTIFGMPEWVVLVLGAAAVGGLALVLMSRGKHGTHGYRARRHAREVTERPRRRRKSKSKSRKSRRRGRR